MLLDGIVGAGGGVDRRGCAARWAGHRAAAAEAGGHQGLWLDGDAAAGSRATRRSPRS